MGWLKDVGVKGQEYQLTSTFVWVGTIVAAPLVRWLIPRGGLPLTRQAAQGVRRLPLGKYLGYSVLIWSAASVLFRFATRS